MTYIIYKEKRFQAATTTLIEKSNEIIAEYQKQGFSLTLRQLYYQLVARGIIPNSQREYRKLGSTISNARDAGLVSWTAIEDRTRNVQSNAHWDNPKQIVQSAIYSYKIDMWENQEYRPEVWIEKDALTGVISQPCRELDIPYFSCRGYTSASEMWKAGHWRAKAHIDNGQIPVILHLGDHDPSGIDMTRDIVDRLETYSTYSVKVDRLALNLDQIKQFNPPPNPAKITDSRSDGYIALYGTSSWELDALDPTTLSNLIRDAVSILRDDDAWAEAEAKLEEGKQWLRDAIGDAAA